MTAAGNEAEISTSRGRRLLLFNLTYFFYPLSCRDPFEGYCFFVCFIFAILRCSGLFWF